MTFDLMLFMMTLMEVFDRNNRIATFVRSHRKELGYTQREFSERVGVGYNFIRELEQGKPTLRLDRVEQVLNFFGYTVAPVPVEREAE